MMAVHRLQNPKTFYEEGNASQFEFALSLYSEVLALKAVQRNKKIEDLSKLDSWYQNDFPKTLKRRMKDPHVTYDELLKLIKWKLSRGKFKARIKEMVQMNTPRVVQNETKKAFRQLFKRRDLAGALSALCNLKGIGPATASVVLAAASPETAPFMADECLLAVPEMEGSLDYSTQDYLKYSQLMVDRAKVLNEESDNGESGKWDAHRLELAVWSHYVAYDLNPELLNKMPGCEQSSSPQKPSNGEVTSANGEENGNGVANGTVTDTDEDSRLSAEVSAKTTDDENAETSEPYSENPSENPSIEASPEPSLPPNDIEATVNSVKPELNDAGLNKPEPTPAPEESNTPAPEAVEPAATIQDTPTPVLDTPTPVLDTPTPVLDTPTAALDTGAPVLDTVTPVQDTPVLEAVTPAGDALTPITPVVEKEYATIDAVKRPFDDASDENGVNGDSLEPEEKKCRLTSL